MKKFIVKETRPAMAVWTYEVEAVSESEAVAKVFDDMDIKKVDLAYDVDFEAEMGVEVDEEIPTHDEIISDSEVISFTKQQLIEYTRIIQSRALEAAKEAIKESGVDIESYVEIDLYGRELQVEVDNNNIYREIISNVEDVFETDDDSIKDEIDNVLKHLFKEF